ncbi:MAG: amidohydrolase [Patescibacteria group bacterium]|nr:amidohydrolase [Patescibacteria group bacterium]
MNQKEESDIIIKNGVILTINDYDEIIYDGAIVVKKDKIIDLGKYSDIKNRYKPKKEINAKGCVVMPGLVNTHTHLAMSIFKGLADDLPLDKWLSEHIFPAEEKFVDEEFCHWGTKLALAEMILSGTTTFCDMYFFEKETGRVAEEVGVRGVIGEGIVSKFGNENDIFENKLKLTKELLSEFENSSLVSIAIEPHSCYTCGKEILVKSKEFAKKNNLLYIIHLAETKKEFDDIKNEFGFSPVEYLDKIGVLNEKTLAAHCVWLSDKDIKILKERKVNISHCPESNMKLASGISPIAKLLKNSINVSLGTDGSASNNNLNMFSEMNCAAKLAKVSTLDSTVLSAKEIVRMATIEGAKVLGMENEIGSLEIGKKSDIIILDFNQPHLVPVYDYYSHLVYSVCGSDVKSSIINGKIIMEKRKILTFDVKETMRKANAIAKKVKTI